MRRAALQEQQQQQMSLSSSSEEHEQHVQLIEETFDLNLHHYQPLWLQPQVVVAAGLGFVAAALAVEHEHPLKARAAAWRQWQRMQAAACSMGVAQAAWKHQGRVCARLTCDCRCCCCARTRTALQQAVVLAAGPVAMLWGIFLFVLPRSFQKFAVG